MKLKWVGFIVLSCGLLVGCEETSTVNADNETQASGAVLESQEQRLNDLMPQGVKDGRVSQETYLEVLRYADEIDSWNQRAIEYNTRLKEDRSLKKNDEFINEYVSFWSDLNVYMKGYYLNPKTDADYELNKHFVEIVYSTESLTREMIDYIKTGESYHAENATGYSRSRGDSSEALFNAMIKYNLITE